MKTLIAVSLVLLSACGGVEEPEIVTAVEVNVQALLPNRIAASDVIDRCMRECVGPNAPRTGSIRVQQPGNICICNEP